MPGSPRGRAHRRGRGGRRPRGAPPRRASVTSRSANAATFTGANAGPRYRTPNDDATPASAAPKASAVRARAARVGSARANATTCTTANRTSGIATRCGTATSRSPARLFGGGEPRRVAEVERADACSAAAQLQREEGRRARGLHDEEPREHERGEPEGREARITHGRPSRRVPGRSPRRRAAPTSPRSRRRTSRRAGRRARAVATTAKGAKRSASVAANAAPTRTVADAVEARGRPRRARRA